MPCIVGFDTSCYTTSLAIYSEENGLLHEGRKVLSVAKGKNGLRQSEALFQHLQNIPELIEQIPKEIIAQVTGICVSTKPRPLAESYMPVFKAGHNFARALSKVLNVSLRETSHQEGHIMSGLWSAGITCINRFICVHLSGGTTEFALVAPSSYGTDFQIELFGGSTDLHAGQLVDRVGVLGGTPFPAGPNFEAAAIQGEHGKIAIPSSVKGFDVSFSGAESMARRLIENGEKFSDVALAVQYCLAKTLEKVLEKAVNKYGVKDVLIVGGVAANSFLRERLRKRLEHQAVGARLYFAEPRFSTDNAVGVAIIGSGSSVLST